LDYLQDKWGTETEWDELVLEFFAWFQKYKAEMLIRWSRKCRKKLG